MGRERRKKAIRKAGAAACAALIAGGCIGAGMKGAYAVARPTDSDKASVTVTNVQDGAKVTAYRVVSPEYATYGFVRFREASGAGGIADWENPKASEINALAAKLNAGTATADSETVMTGNAKNGYTASLGAGEYVVLVENPGTDGEYAYSPMVISLYYTDANSASSLAVRGADASKSFMEGSAAVYAKRTKTTITKRIENPDGVGGGLGDDMAQGDTDSFALMTAVPSYSDAYSEPEFTIKDEQEPGFDAAQSIKVTVGGTEYSTSGTTFAITNPQTLDGGKTANDFTVSFVPSFTMAHRGQAVKIQYKSKLNAQAKEKLEANVNKVSLTYSTDLKDGTHTITDEIREYSFPVTVKKVNEDGKGLRNAEFTLIRQNVTGGQAAHTEALRTGDDGTATFHRLDEGTYTIQETNAPAGYAINPKIYRLTVTPVYDGSGKLTGYTAELYDTEADKAVGKASVDNADADILAGNITDERLLELPGTGGSGKGAAAAVAVLLGGMAAGFAVSAKKKKKKEGAEKAPAEDAQK